MVSSACIILFFIKAMTFSKQVVNTLHRNEAVSRMCWLLATGLIQVPLIIVIYEAGGIKNHQAYYSCFHFSIVNLKHTVMFRKSWRDWQFLLSQTSDKCCQACRSHWLVFLFSISTFVGVCRTMLGPVSKPLRMVWCLRKSSGLRFQKPRSRACHLSFV